MNLNKYVVGALILLAALLGFLVGKQSVVVVGGNSSLYRQVLEGIQVGSINYSESSAGGSSLALSGSTTSTSPTAAQICSNSVITWGVTESSSTFILPSAVNLENDCLKNVGDTKRLLLYNTGVATTSLTVVYAGASSTVDYVSTTTLSGLNVAEIVLTNLSTSKASANMIRALVYPGQL